MPNRIKRWFYNQMAAWCVLFRQRDVALEYYGRFADMWKKADPELQPRVADVRRRIAELTRQEN